MECELICMAKVERTRSQVCLGFLVDCVLFPEADVTSLDFYSLALLHMGTWANASKKDVSLERGTSHSRYEPI